MNNTNLITLRFEDFPSQTTDKIRYSDTDRQGHVNNAVFSSFLETGRVELLYDPLRPLADSGCSFVIANLSLTFLKELKWPGIVKIGTGLTRIGNSSMSMVQCLYQDDEVVATAETVIVHMNETTKRSTPLSDQARSVLSALFLTQRDS